MSFTLATALDQKSADYEVIVSDNQSADATREVVESIGDTRLRYFNTRKRLPMTGNYEFGLEQARGAYVVFIGDDDAVMPGALDRLLTRLRAVPEPTVHMWPLHIYDWPAGGRPARVDHLAPVRPGSELDLKAKARRVCELGGWKYYELPSPYHSAVPRRILDAIRERTGRVFHSTQPDVFTAMAIPAFAGRAINLGHTVTLNGRSAQSNGLGFVQRSALPNIERFIREYGDYKFHPSLFGGVPGAANMIPDAVLVARDFFPELYGDVAFNFSAMWAYVCRLRFASHAEVLRSRRAIRLAHRFSVPAFLGYSAVHEASALRRKLLNRLTRLGPLRDKTPDNVRDFVRALAQGPRGDSWT